MPSAHVLRPMPRAALDYWRELVLANNQQVERTRERVDGSDFHRPIISFFRADPTRRDESNPGGLARWRIRMRHGLM